MLLNRISDPVDCANVGGTGRRAACTRCRAIRPTLRNRTFGSLAELGARHRVDMHRKGAWHRPGWVAPVKVGGTGNGGWHRQMR